MDTFLEIEIPCNEETQETLIATLDQLEFDSYWQEDGCLKAYVMESRFVAEALDALLTQLNISSSGVKISKLENKNWNEEWEKNFDPVIIDTRAVIKAPFHNLPEKFPLEILIQPKMSFGTGHHETTRLMVEYLLELDLSGKNVMDAGTGTGVLAIVAEKRGAALVDAFDIEDWAFENFKENTILNRGINLKISLGTIREADLRKTQYDLILANIQRNVLLEEMAQYASKLGAGAELLISGFYTQDADVLVEEASRHGLEELERRSNNNWVAMKLRKL